MINYNFQKHEQEAKEFLRDVASGIGTPGDLEQAGRVLNAVLHTLRDRITPQEALDLVAQLPVYVRAAYIDGWNFREKPPRVKTKEGFLLEVLDKAPRTNFHDFGSLEETRMKTEAVFQVLQKRVPAGEIKDIKAQLPEDVAELIHA